MKDAGGCRAARERDRGFKDRDELHQGDKRGFFRARQRSGARRNEADSTGLRPEPNLQVGERSQGRRSRPLRRMSTVRAKGAAR